jgi:16S rRNA (uracil1498-N3)-methyltransferase
MQRHRFYSSLSQFTSSAVTLDADEAHHLTRVLRLGEGARVFVFDGAGNEWACEVTRAAKREVELTLLHQLDDPVESPLALTLAQSLVKGDKFDWIVQKTAELGVARIVPLVTEHSELHKADARADNKLQRWRRIAMEAVKQCGRRRLVEIAEPVPFNSFCETETAGLFFSEQGGRGWADVAATAGAADRLTCCVGPEGGWSEAERKKAEGHGWNSVTLGSRILRAETAAVAAVTLAQHQFGDLR